MASPKQTPILYALGSNSSGQLGIGHTEDVSTPQKCIFRENGKAVLPGRDPSVGEVKKIVAGGNHTLVLTDTGRLFVAGRVELDDGMDTVQTSDFFREITHLVQFQLVDLEDYITDITATWEASFMATSSNKVLCLGKGAKGELGISQGAFEDRDPNTNGVALEVFARPVAAGSEKLQISGIEASMGHVVILLANGEVYGWGNCRKGQLGEQHCQYKILWEPTRLDVTHDGTSILPFAPERVIVGREYTIFLRVGDMPVVWGEQKLFGKMDFDWRLGHDVIAVSGWSSVHILWGKSSLGAVASVGKNNHGQFAPAGLPPVRAIATGSEHCVALTANQQVIAWGWGEHGNCGEKMDEKGNIRDRWNVIPMPQLEEGDVMKDVAAGCATTFVICGKKED